MAGTGDLIGLTRQPLGQHRPSPGRVAQAEARNAGRVAGREVNWRVEALDQNMRVVGQGQRALVGGQRVELQCARVDIQHFEAVGIAAAGDQHAPA